jgi:hypothetical protein
VISDKDKQKHDELMDKFVKGTLTIKDNRKEYKELCKLNKYLLKIHR